MPPRLRPLAILALVSFAPGCGSSGSVQPPQNACTIPDAGSGSGATGGGPSACANPIGTSEPSTGETVQPLGQVAVGQSVSFNIPANTVSVTIVEQAVTAPDSITYQSATQGTYPLDNTAVPLRVWNPRTGKVLYDDNPSSPVTDPTAIENLTAWFGSNSPATGTLTLPNTTGGLKFVGAGLPEDTWMLTVSDYAYECTFQQPAGACCAGGSKSSVYDVTVITKQAPAGTGIPTTGTIDIAVYFATTTADTPSGVPPIPLSAATANAGGDPDLKRMEQTLRGLLGKASITVGSVTYYDLPAALQNTYATGINVDETGACSDLAQLFRYTKEQGSGNRFNIFFVSNFKSTSLQGSNQVVGIDGSIPGPATIAGSASSGAGVATHDLRFGRSSCSSGSAFSFLCGADVTAYIIAHEAGHFMGLYHTTESDGTAFDTLADTGRCACRSCAPASSRSKCADAVPAPSSSSAYQVSVADCTKTSTGCTGGENLMFWILDDGSLGELSAEQARVMRANPLVH